MNKRKSKEPKSNTAKAQSVPAQETGAMRGPGSDILALQHSAGNQATGRLLHGAQGQPLDETTRAKMEARLGREFGNVQIHTGEAAAQAAAGMDAAAFTSGQDIAFAAGRYAPHTAEGEQLLAHELTHVAQQEQAGSIENRVSRPSESAERAADQGLVQPGTAAPG